MEYIYPFTVLTVSIGAIEILLPESFSVNKYVHFIMAVVITLMLLSPIQSGLKNIPLLLQGDRIELVEEAYDKTAMTNALEEELSGVLEANIDTLIKQRFNLSVCDIQVDCDVSDPQNVIVNRACVFVEFENRFIDSDIKKFVEKKLDCVCEVIYIDEASKK